MTYSSHLRLGGQRVNSRCRTEMRASRPRPAGQERDLKMSARPPTKGQLKRMIEERLVELRWALQGMEATGNYTTEAREMHQALLAEVELLEKRIREAFTEH